MSGPTIVVLAVTGVCVVAYLRAVWKERQWQRDIERAKRRLARLADSLRAELDVEDAMTRQLEELRSLPVAEPKRTLR